MRRRHLNLPSGNIICEATSFMRKHNIVCPKGQHHCGFAAIYKNGRIISAPTVIAGMKRYVSKKCGYPIWQKGFYDHVIRNQNDYDEICEYIENNPAKWATKTGG